MSLLRIAAAILSVSAPSSVPPPPPLSEGAENGPKRLPAIISFRPGSVACGGKRIAPIRTIQPWPAGAVLPGGGVGQPIRTATVHFRIGPDGRPLNINETLGRQGFPANTSDIVPAFSLWRFPAGREQADCEAEFQATAVPVAAADPEMLYRYQALERMHWPGVNSTVERAAFDRLKPPGDCFDKEHPRPRPHILAYPDFRVIPQEPGTVSYVAFTFDIDDQGRPTSVRLVSSDGNVALERQGTEALGNSRFFSGVRTGCLWFYWRSSGDPVSPPPAPVEGAFQPATSTCEGREWERLEKSFPDQFRYRGIEGWAIVGFDLAPWGEVGNLKVLAAEPAAGFGSQAKRILASAKAKPSPSGRTGCISKIFFKLPVREAEE